MDDILLEIVPLDLGIDSKDKSPLGWKYLDNSHDISYRNETSLVVEFPSYNFLTQPWASWNLCYLNTFVRSGVLSWISWGRVLPP